MAPNVASAAVELRREAAEARDLASTLKDPASVADLLNYACTLESDAADWEGGSAVVQQHERETRGHAKAWRRKKKKSSNFVAGDDPQRTVRLRAKFLQNGVPLKPL